jgi:hypothetical protein
MDGFQQLEQAIQNAMQLMPSPTYSIWDSAEDRPSYLLQTAVQDMMRDMNRLKSYASPDLHDALSMLEDVWNRAVDTMYKAEQQLQQTFRRSAALINDALNTVQGAIDDESY